jgi:hypothetical protein
LRRAAPLLSAAPRWPPAAAARLRVRARLARSVQRARAL